MLFVGSSFIATAQDNAKLAGIKATEQHVAAKQGHNVNVDFVVDLSEMPKISSNFMMEVTPILKSNKSNETIELPIFLITGRTRNIMLQRNMDSKNNPYRQPGHEPKYIIKRNNGKSQQFKYQAQVPYNIWMKDASLVLVSKNTGCANCDKGSEENCLTSQMLVPLYEANWKLSKITPKGELRKYRQESLSAFITFIVAKYNIVPTLGNNQQELAKISSKMGEMAKDKSLTIDKVEMIGYASPEGNQEANKTLSQNRVKSFADYLIKQYPRFKSMVKTDSKGSDWDGLAKAIEEGDYNKKAEILNIINTKPAEERMSAIVALDNGASYRKMLNEIFPKLRRSDVIFSFVVKGFDLKEAKDVIKTHPNRLSLAEVDAIAKSYPENSDESYNAWVVAADAFPNAYEPVNNAVMIDLANGRIAQALKFAEKHASNKKIWGLLGVLYAMNENYPMAEKYLTEAAKLNLPDAQYNLDEYKKFAEDNF